MNDCQKEIWITNKDGKTSECSKDITELIPDDNNRFYRITFKNKKTYFYKKENVEIRELVNETVQESNQNSINYNSVYDYLLAIADFSEIKNQNGDNLLVKKLKKNKSIKKESVLDLYINRKLQSIINPKLEKDLIFPFGCNNSQFKAVENAMTNKLSIIQGPPGTGKTQTILNIIANLIINNKTVLVVSNNNSATANIKEKLASEKYQLDFICASLGCKENADLFIQNQNNAYPEYINDWLKFKPVFSSVLSKDTENLKKYFDLNEKISIAQNELNKLETEYIYFHKKNQNIEMYPKSILIKRKSDFIMNVWQSFQTKFNIKEKLSLFMKLHLFLGFNIGNVYFWKTNVERVFYTIQESFYITKKRELAKIIDTCKKQKDSFNPEKVYEESLELLKFTIANRCIKNKAPEIFKDEDGIFRKFKYFTKEYPIVLSTTFSSVNCLPYFNRNFLYDYVIMDEASQIDVVTGALALACAKNAVIVGDKNQLPNVVPEKIAKKVDEEFRKFSIEEGYKFTHSFLESVEKILPLTKQTLLREHYRCHPKIIDFCNQKFYNGQLLIMTNDRNEKDVLKVIKTTGGNHCSDKCNLRQIEIIQDEILPMINESKENIGIIAPYNNQVNMLHEKLADYDSATVHKFQGREKNAIIISTVDNDITEFTDDAKLLNVAISRAKKQLFIVTNGNQQNLKNNISDLVRYIQYNNFDVEESKISSIFDLLYSQYTEQRFKYLKRKQLISNYPSENLMYSIIKETLDEPQFNQYGVVFELPLKEIISLDEKRMLPDELLSYVNSDFSHCDFVLYSKITKKILLGIEVDGYSYHKKSSVQYQRDLKKNKIFEIIGLKLVRYSTKDIVTVDTIKNLLLSI